MKCPICGYENDSQAKVCLACNSLLEKEEPQNGEPSSLGNTNNDTTVTTVKKCPNCAYENQSDAQVCLACGAFIDSVQPTEKLTDKDNSDISDVMTEENSEVIKKCPNCSYENLPNAQVCLACGALLDSSTQANEEEKQSPVTEIINNIMEFFSWQKLVAVLGALVGVLLVFSLVKLIFSSPEYDTRDVVISGLKHPDDKSFTFLYNDEPIDGEIEATSMNTFSSIDGETVIALSQAPAKEGESVLDSPINLFVVTKKGITPVAEDIIDASISPNGKYVAYRDADETLYIYTVKSEEKEKIASNVSSDMVFSPEGKKLAYNTYEEKEVDGESTIKYTMYVYDGKDSSKIGTDLSPIALSDSGKYIYYIDEDKEGLYVTNLKGDSSKISGDVKSSDSFLFNRDASEIIFSSDGRYYISKKGKDKEKIANGDYLCPLLPSSVATSNDGYIGVKTFADGYFGAVKRENDSVTLDLIYFTKKLEGEKVTGSVKNAIISDDLDVIYYLKSGSLYRLNANKPDSDADEIADDVESFGITPDGSGVYYTDDADTLYYAKGKSKPKKIADDVHSFGVTYDGYVLFILDYEVKEGTYVGSGTLYCSKKGSDKKKIADDVRGIGRYPSYTVYISDYNTEESTGTLYIAKKGVKFKKIASDVDYGY